MSAIIEAYLASDFDRAARMARGAGDAELASRIERFGGLWRRIQAARFGASVRSVMEQAMALDRRIARNPQFRDRLRGHVVGAYLAQARSQSEPTASCGAVRHALVVDPSSAEARQMGARCEVRARGMMAEAAAAPPQRAMSLYGRVLLMVPSNTPTAQQAQSRLQALRRQHTADEDE